MDIKIGEVVKVDKHQFICKEGKYQNESMVKRSEGSNCLHCDFYCTNACGRFACSGSERKDKKNVYFEYKMMLVHQGGGR